ncbi:MAG: hypothetical protein C5B49_09745 [Bdellovibrio sp.]|nr:MAG: hypothetical protein C5B49_09745 [Bdellovibrio sp.]
MNISKSILLILVGAALSVAGICEARHSEEAVARTPDSLNRMTTVYFVRTPQGKLSRATLEGVKAQVPVTLDHSNTRDLKKLKAIAANAFAEKDTKKRQAIQKYGEAAGMHSKQACFFGWGGLLSAFNWFTPTVTSYYQSTTVTTGTVVPYAGWADYGGGYGYAGGVGYNYAACDWAGARPTPWGGDWSNAYGQNGWGWGNVY